MPGRVDDNEMDVQMGTVRGVPTVAIVAVALTSADLKPAVDAALAEGGARVVVDLGGVGDVRPDVYDYLARQRTFLQGQGGDLAVVVSPADQKDITQTGFREALPVFDGTENAVTFLQAAAG